VLQFDANARGGFRARVLKSPFGEGGAGFSLPWLAGADAAAHDAAGLSDGTVYRGASALGTRPRLDVGAELFRSVFQGPVRTLFDKSRGQLDVSPQLGLRLKIKLDTGDEDTGALADLPWELLYDSEAEDYFALSRQMSVVRYLDVPRPSQPIAFAPPLRILAVGASPHGLPPLDLAEEEEQLDQLRGADVEVEFVAHASAGAVRQKLAGDTFHVLHFMGHGAFDPATGEGGLAFEKPDGSVDLVSGRAFATKVRDLRSLGVVVLNACDTARASSQGGSPYRGVATALVHGGVPAVIAMQQPISDRAAIGFGNAFYRHLARGDSIDKALTEGRQAIHSAEPDSLEWATPVLFLRIPEGNVFVAKPAEAVAAERLAELPTQLLPRAAVALPAAEPAAPPVPETVRPASPPGRGLGLKIAAGAGGAALVFVLAAKVLGPAADPGPAEPQSTEVQPQTTEGLMAEAGPDPGSQFRSQGSRGSQDTGSPRQSTEPRSVQPEPQDPVENRTEQAAVPPVVTPSPEPVATAPAVAADLSKLSAQLVSITSREEGGLRVTVSLRNGDSRPLSAELDPDLSDEQGRRYSVLSGDSQLDLAPGSSSQATFDFPIPKLGSKQFHLALMADGRRIRVTGSPMAFEGSP
ncbi:MAG TPA: CHAT domain-containing protein, partial [Thermoanaerobaculia bacterium]|nr:CHAT domain-containing protein [Thermoanaerobaculia bacterium]